MPITQSAALAIPDPVTGTAQKANPYKGRFFSDQTYHFETLRTVGYTVSGGADISEVLETVKLITEGDAQSWFSAWAATSERVHLIGDCSRDPISKGNAYLRAHSYQRLGGFLLPPDDPKRPASWEKEVAYFQQGLDAFGISCEHIVVPYERASLRALYLPSHVGAKKPLIVIVGGFDSTLEELYLVLGRAAGERGYSVLLYEGPGQGQSLRDGLTFVPDWERPTKAVLDAFLSTHERPSKMVLIGMSFGGYFAPRAAAFEERFDGVVAFDTCFDFEEAARPIFKAVIANPMAINDPSIAWAYHNALWTMGGKSPQDVQRKFGAYTLAPVAARIKQDVLILAGEADHFIPFHQTAAFEKSLVNARSVTTRIFDRASGGAEHCQCGATTLFHASVFDWLIEKFGD